MTHTPSPRTSKDMAPDFEETRSSPRTSKDMATDFEETRSTSMQPAPDLTPRPTYLVKAGGDEARSYDFNAARPPHKTITNAESTALFIKMCLGGGAVTMHEAYYACGVWTALCLTMGIGVLYGYCMYIITHSAQKLYGRIQVPQLTYSDLVEASIATCPWYSIRKLSKSFRYLITGMCCTYHICSCCIYQVILARVCKQLIERTDVLLDNDHTPIRVYILILIVPNLLLCLISSMKYLAPFSLVADGFMIAVAITTIYYGTLLSEKAPLDMPAFNSVSGLFEFIGVLIFGLEGAGIAMAIENHMETPTQIIYVLTSGMAVVLTVMMIIGFFGSWGFGEDVYSPITYNFPWSALTVMLKIFMIITISVNFILNLWLVFHLIWRFLKRFHQPKNYWIWERVYRCMIGCFMVLVAFSLPTVSKFIALSGSFCTPAIGLIYPAIISLSVDWEEPGLGFLMWRLWQFIIILIIGFVIFFAGTYINAKELITELYII